MPKNLNQNKGIESGRDVGEPKIKRKGSNLGAMLENPKQNEGIESNPSAMSENPKYNKGIKRVQRYKERAMPQSKASILCQKPTNAHKVKTTKLGILQTFILEEKASSLIHNIQYPPTTDRGSVLICT